MNIRMKTLSNTVNGGRGGGEWVSKDCSIKGFEEERKGGGNRRDLMVNQRVRDEEKYVRENGSNSFEWFAKSSSENNSFWCVISSSITLLAALIEAISLDTEAWREPASWDKRNTPGPLWRTVGPKTTPRFFVVILLESLSASTRFKNYI